MTIKEVYQALGTPPNLQEHMLRVTGISLFIASRWKGTPLNIHTLKTMLLLHDVGNIVKFDLNNHPEFLGEKEQRRIPFWKKRQQEMQKKYGSDDHEATVAMLRDMQISEEIITLVYGMGYWNVGSLLLSNNWHLKIGLYSDLRVGPFGIITLQERLDDVHRRLRKYQQRPHLIECAKELERQVQNNMSEKITAITNETCKINNELRNFKILQ